MSSGSRNRDPVFFVPRDVFFTHILPFFTHRTIFSALQLISKNHYTFFQKNKSTIDLILWNGPKPPWAVRDGWTYTHLNQMHYNILHGSGRIILLKKKLHSDKIIGLERLFSRRGLYASVCFSGGVKVFAKDKQLSQEMYLNFKSIAQNHIRSFTSCAVLRGPGYESPPTYFVCGGKNGKIVVWPMDSLANILEGFVANISSAHIRSLISIPSNDTQFFVSDGDGVIRLVEITQKHAPTSQKAKGRVDLECLIRYKWDTRAQTMESDEFLSNLHENESANLDSPTKIHEYAVTGMCAIEDKMCACTKKRGLYVFSRKTDGKGTANFTWRKQKLFGNHSRFVNDRNLSCLEFLTSDVVVIGTRGASMTGGSPMILSLLKDECVFAVSLQAEEIIWSLPVRRSVSSVIPLNPNIVVVSSDLEGLQVWNTQTRTVINKIDQRPNTMWFANLKFTTPGRLIGTIDGDVIELQFHSKAKSKIKKK